MATLLLDNPRGSLLARDELAGWFGSFDRYSGKGKNGSDVPNWLSMHSGEGIIVDRKSGTPRTIQISSALVSITGGIQPGILRRILSSEHRESGLAARMLPACPPRVAKRWTEAETNPAAKVAYAGIVEKLLDLQLVSDSEGTPRPALVGMSSDAKARFVAYYNSHNREQAELSGDLSAAWSKLEEYAPRLALVNHMARWAAGEQIDPEVLDAESMATGIRLAEWFKREAVRVYAMLDESKADAKTRRLVEWIHQKGEPVTARRLQQGLREYKDSAAKAEAALNELAEGGYGEWIDSPAGPKGGRPSRAFELSTSSTSTEPRETQECGGFVDVDTVDEPDSDDWGEL